MSIPRDFVNIDTSPPKERNPIPIIAMGFLFALLGAGLLAAFLGSLSAVTSAAVIPPSSVNNAADNLHITPEVSTNTAEPSPTQEPTRTPFATFTPTSEPMRETVKNVIITQQIEVTRLVVITATPHPATRTPTPTTDYNQNAFIETQRRSNERKESELSRYKAFNVALSILSVGGSVALSVALIAGAFRWATSPARRKIADLRDQMEGEETTMEEIESRPAMSPVDGVTVGELRKIRLMLAQHKTPTDIELEVYEYAGGSGYNSARQKVARAIEYLTTPPPHSPSGQNTPTQA